VGITNVNHQENTGLNVSNITGKPEGYKRNNILNSKYGTGIQTMYHFPTDEAGNMRDGQTNSVLYNQSQSRRVTTGAQTYF
jgi:hypothetical protein